MTYDIPGPVGKTRDGGRERAERGGGERETYSRLFQFLCELYNLRLDRLKINLLERQVLLDRQNFR
jgi:hypothetical protein